MMINRTAPPTPAAIAMIFSRGRALDPDDGTARPRADALEGGKVIVVVTGGRGSSATAVGWMIEVTVLSRQLAIASDASRTIRRWQWYVGKTCWTRDRRDRSLDSEALARRGSQGMDTKRERPAPRAEG